MIKNQIKFILLTLLFSTLSSFKATSMMNDEDSITNKAQCKYCPLRLSGRKVVLQDPGPDESSYFVCPQCLVDSLPPIEGNSNHQTPCDLKSQNLRGSPPPHPKNADGVEYVQFLQRWIPYKMKTAIIDCNGTKLVKKSKGYLHHYYYDPSKSTWSWKSGSMKAANNLHGPEFDDEKNPHDHSYDYKIENTDKKSFGQYSSEHKGEN
ncbi:MAG TPA: hypothetical protein VGA94_04450 [Thermodesulfobacteriota bacterium]